MSFLLRPELEPPVLDPQKVDQLTNVIGRIVDALDNDTDVIDLMAQHNAIVGHNQISADRCQKLYASMSEQDAAREALMPRAVRLSDITRDEMVEIARRIKDPVTDEAARTYYLAVFEANAAMSATSDLFFWPDEDWIAELGGADPTPEQIVEKALDPSGRAQPS